MKLRFNQHLFLFAAILSLAAVPTLRAEFIQPVAVLASNGAETQDALINGQGFDEPGVGSPQSIHSRTGSEMWSGVGSIREFVVFDLGQSVSLTKVYVWNYNVQDATDVGMKEVEVQVSSDTDMATANFNTIARISLKEGGETAQIFDVVGTNVRLVKLKGLSNWGQGFTVGLAEVRFESGTIAGNVPKIVLNSPRDGEEIRFGSDVALDAAVTDSDGDLDKVEFFDGDILLTNKVRAPFTGTWKGASQGDHAVRVVATDKSGKVAWVSANINVRELVADRIIKIDDTADEGEGLNQIRYSGSWNLAPGGATDPRYNNNDHYHLGNNRIDYFEVRFNGVMIEAYATVASHHGTGMASIDGGPESKAIYKAAQRAEQVLVWRSPILPNGEHVLRIRVTGDGVVTADRFDVSVSDKPVATTATIKEVTASFTNLVVKLEDAASSVVNPSTVKLSLNGAAVQANVTKAPPITTVTHTPSSPFQPGATLAIRIDSQSMTGASITNETTFTLPAPPFPLAGLGGPASSAGNWGLRQIWNAGRADALVSAVDIAQQSNLPGFTGRVDDTRVSVINLAKTANPGTGGFIPGDEPIPAESKGLTESDFVLVAHATVKVPRTGDWTIGVHTDEGFALRVKGARFTSATGNGIVDPDFPEFISAAINTADSNTRGVLAGLAAGTYELEFISWERAGSAYYEIYAAEGAFEDDAATDQWLLIGAPGGWEIVAGTKLEARRLTVAGGRLTIELASPQPDSQHQLQESADLKTWQPVSGVTFEKLADGVRVSINSMPGLAKFYRVVIP